MNFDTPTIIDNFLPEKDFIQIRDLVMNTDNKVFPFYLQDTVAFSGETPPGHWSWMGFHMLYHNDEPTSPWWKTLSPIFIDKFFDMGIYRGMLRMKCNFYPYTEILHQHDMHTDYHVFTPSAVFSLNTCDGYTIMKDGTKIDSVENRIVFFDGSKEHASTTTTTAYGRYNINFNLA